MSPMQVRVSLFTKVYESHQRNNGSLASSLGIDIAYQHVVVVTPPIIKISIENNVKSAQDADPASARGCRAHRICRFLANGKLQKMLLTSGQISMAISSSVGTVLLRSWTMSLDWNADQAKFSSLLSSSFCPAMSSSNRLSTAFRQQSNRNLSSSLLQVRS